MRKFSLCFSASLFLIALTSFTGAPVLQGNSHVNGGGTAIEFGEISTFAMNAVKRSNGSVSGHVTYQVRSFDVAFRMNITCFTINGNRATVTGVVSSIIGSDEPPVWLFVGLPATFVVEDNGQDVDKISDVFLGETACSGNADTYISISGNIDIKE